MNTPPQQHTLIAKASGEFHGGIYPAENKKQSMRLPIGSLPIPSELIFPLNQHMGAPAEPIVQVGDKVLAGQKIADATGAFSAAIHASSSGTISAIEERALPHPSGMQGLCIIINTDGQHHPIKYPVDPHYLQQDPSELVNRIRSAGITGLGGAGFPTAVKLSPKANHKINTLIINGTECEPYITADHSLMLHHAEEVIKGVGLLSHILYQPTQVLIGIEDNKPDAIEALACVLKQRTAKNIRIITFPTKYPSGGEKQLIQLLTGKEVPSGTIPANLGIVVQNVGTAVAAYRAVALGQPLTSRITTLVGNALKTQRNYQVLLGTPIEFALTHSGFDAHHNERLIMGGPMMGFTLKTSSAPIIKSTNCIIAPSTTELPAAQAAQECIRCGHCAEACPASLLPQQLYWYTKAEDYDKAQNHHLFDCIECGACAYVCPSNIPLVQYYRSAKGTIRQQEHEKTKSDHARQRFEFRQQRFAKAEAEKIAKREARKQAAEKAKRLQAEKQAAHPEAASNNPQKKPDPVAEAMARVNAKENDPAAQQAKLERSINSSKNRITTLQTKRENADEVQKNALSAQIKQVEVRLQEAEKQLAQLTHATTTTPTEHKEKAATTISPPPIAKDAASSAIEKAKANAAALATMPEEEKLKKQLTSLEQRLEKAKQRLANAEAEHHEHTEAFNNNVTNIEHNIKAIRLKLGIPMENNR